MAKLASFPCQIRQAPQGESFDTFRHVNAFRGQVSRELQDVECGTFRKLLNTFRGWPILSNLDLSVYFALSAQMNNMRKVQRLWQDLGQDAPDNTDQKNHRSLDEDLAPLTSDQIDEKIASLKVEQKEVKASKKQIKALLPDVLTVGDHRKATLWHGASTLFNEQANRSCSE
ncbi:hypothetical protein F5144DRAFT_545208 [Chaetomium tenue]|uniref:Uncharacterized protein n=1 Tax=Chaetomium tenue TaxID=1854479 RepID=A0ACB7PM22_9PEZI|nr:hypothetical protein F5144DRAFT_545208 [Chaetomium globosum]